MRYQLPDLPYAYDALEPQYDEQTVRLHHDIHHKSYVDGLNKAEEKLQAARKEKDFALVKHWERELAFHGSGHILHTLFWESMSPNGGGPATGKIGERIQDQFGSFESFRDVFSAAAGAVEGSGWAVLAWNRELKTLQILTAEKHQDLTVWGALPLMALDVWEHAYYLKYQNQRPKWIEAWWHLVNWDSVNERFDKAMN